LLTLAAGRGTGSGFVGRIQLGFEQGETRTQLDDCIVFLVARWRFIERQRGITCNGIVRNVVGKVAVNFFLRTSWPLSRPGLLLIVWVLMLIFLACLECQILVD
jgi:hypothetical protein